MSDRALTTIASSALTAEIDTLGAELHALRDREGRDLLWNGDPAFWTGRAPILFPIVGMLNGGRYRLDGETLGMSKHGFARRRVFDVVETSAGTVTMRLRWDDATWSVYPFAFELDLKFTVEGATLAVVASVRNLGETEDMPASFGFHPAVRWPLPYGQPRAAHRIQFEHEEPAPIRRIDAEGLVKPEGYATPVVGRDLSLRDDLFVDDAVIFDQVRSRAVRYGAPEGPSLEVRFPHTELLGVWTKPGAGFICIEPWHGWADPVGFEGDFRTKPGIVLIPPGEARDFMMSITLRT